MQQVAEWLEKFGLGQYAQRFVENDNGARPLIVPSAQRDFLHHQAQAAADSQLSALSPQNPGTLGAYPVGWGCQMADRPEREKILEVAVSGIPQIAKVIADFPIEFQEGAFEVAERRYQQTVSDLGYAEADAQGWISLVMFRLRNQVAELSTKKLEANPAQG
jgi:hypothetical protein